MAAQSVVAVVIFCFWLSVTFEADAVCLDEDEGKLKFVNDPCKTDSDCYGNPSQTSCKEGRCKCAKGFIEEIQETTLGDNRTFCGYPPYKGSECKSECVTPYKCALDPSFPVPPTKKRCQCLPPYVELYGDCQLECKEDEFYADGECKKRCSANEYLDFNECKKASSLGETCKVSMDCSVAYSECQNGKCTCVAGFTPNSKNNRCESAKRTCPFGDPIRANGHLVKCDVFAKETKKTGQPLFFPIDEKPNRDGLEITDNCPEGHFCMATDSGNYLPRSTGHCCLYPKPSCPIGDPHPNATCNFLSPVNVGRILRPLIDETIVPVIPLSHKDTRPDCPHLTHSCVPFSYGGGFQMAVCCPLACPKAKLYINGTCYPLRDLGDQCDFHAQCIFGGGTCKNGKCECNDNTTLVVRGNSRYCDFSCRNGKGNCFKTLKLGEKCPAEKPTPCGINAKCSPKTNTCICECGMSKLDDNHCGTQPRCLQAKNSSDSSGGSDKVSLGSHSLCIPAGNTESPIKTAVKRCPRGHYCGEYISDLLGDVGVCCPKPEKPLCDDGTVAEKICDPKKSGECGHGEKCVKFNDAARADDPYICCSARFQIVNENK